MKTAQVSYLQQNPQNIILLRVFLYNRFVTARVFFTWHRAEMLWLWTHVSQVTCLVFGSDPRGGQRAPGALPRLQHQAPVKPWHSRRATRAFLKALHVGWKASSFHQILNFLSYCICATEPPKKAQQIFFNVEMLFESLGFVDPACPVCSWVLLTGSVLVWKYFAISDIPFSVQCTANYILLVTQVHFLFFLIQAITENRTGILFHWISTGRHVFSFI